MVTPRQHWDDQVLIKLFTYLNNNFDQWYYDPFDTYAKAMQDIGVSRSVNSVKMKVDRMLLGFNNRSSRERQRVWKNKKICSLVKNFNNKFEEKKRRGIGGRRRLVRKRLVRKRPVREEQEPSIKVEPVDPIVISDNEEEMSMDTDEMSMDTSIFNNNITNKDEIRKWYNSKKREHKTEYMRGHQLFNEISELEASLRQKINEREAILKRLRPNNK